MTMAVLLHYQVHSLMVISVGLIACEVYSTSKKIFRKKSRRSSYFFQLCYNSDSQILNNQKHQKEYLES